MDICRIGNAPAFWQFVDVEGAVLFLIEERSRTVPRAPASRSKLRIATRLSSTPPRQWSGRMRWVIRMSHSTALQMIAVRQGVDQAITAAGDAWAGRSLHANGVHDGPNAWMYPRIRAPASYWFSVFDGLKYRSRSARRPTPNRFPGSRGQVAEPFGDVGIFAIQTA